MASELIFTQEGHGVHVHVDREAVKRGCDCITVSSRDTGQPIWQGRDLELTGSWRIHQEDEAHPCGASVVLSTRFGGWRPRNYVDERRDNHVA